MMSHSFPPLSNAAVKLPSTRCLSRPRNHPRTLRAAASTPKHGPLCALAELLDNARDAGATLVRIFTLPGAAHEADKARIVLVNNAPGMTRPEAHDCLSFGYSNKSALDVGMFGLGFQHGTMGVGDSALLGTVRLCADTGAQEVTVGLLSLLMLEQMGETEIVLPMLTWSKAPGGADWEVLVPGEAQADVEDVDSSTKLLELYSPYGTVDELRDAVLAHVGQGQQGTVVEIYHLHADELIFDPRAPDGDIRLRDGCKTHTNAASAEEALPLDHSLRAYLEVLYLPHPSKATMAIELCGSPVVPRALAQELHKPLTYTFDPDKDSSRRVRMTFGLDLAPGARATGSRPPKLSAQHGVAVYFRYRLIQARMSVGRAARGGVLGVCELVHVTPEPTKQAFIFSPALTNLKLHLNESHSRFVMSCMTGEHNDRTPLIQMDSVVAAMQAAVDAEVARMEEHKKLQDAVDFDGRPSVCCDDCGKYRFISQAMLDELERNGDARWVCADNAEDAARASCDAPQEEPRADADAGRERERLPESPAPHPEWLPAGWRAVQVPSGTEGRLVPYFYPPAGNSRLRSQREVLRYIAEKEQQQPQPQRGSKRQRGASAQPDAGGASAGGGASGGGGGRARSERVQNAATDRRLLAASAALDAKKRQHEAEAARIKAEKRELDRRQREVRRKEVELRSAERNAARQSSRLAARTGAGAGAAAAPPPPVLRRVCRCADLADEPRGVLTACATDGCGLLFHASCLCLTQAELERRPLECVDHKEETILARMRRTPGLPRAPTPSVSRDVSVASGLARLAGREEPGAEANSRRSRPVNWPDEGVAFTTRNAFAPPSSEPERLRRALERRVPTPGVEIFLLTRAHRAWRHKRWASSADDGAAPLVAPRGVIATAPFAAGDLVGIYTGHVRAMTDRDNESEYIMLLPASFSALEKFRAGGQQYDTVVIDAAVCGNEMRFINSAEGMPAPANCEFVPTALQVGPATDGGEEVAVVVRATRDIQPGDELLADYGEAYPLN